MIIYESSYFLNHFILKVSWSFTFQVLFFLRGMNTTVSQMLSTFLHILINRCRHLHILNVSVSHSVKTNLQSFYRRMKSKQGHGRKAYAYLQSSIHDAQQWCQATDITETGDRVYDCRIAQATYILFIQPVFMCNIRIDNLNYSRYFATVFETLRMFPTLELLFIKVRSIKCRKVLQNNTFQNSVSIKY